MHLTTYRLASVILTLVCLFGGREAVAQWILCSGLDGEQLRSHQIVLLDNRIFVFGGYGMKLDSRDYGPLVEVRSLDVTKLPNLSWRRCGDMNDSRLQGYATTVNGKIYLVGGARTTDDVNARGYNRTTVEYDPVADAYTEKTPMPYGQWPGAAATVGNRIYLIGGVSGSGWIADTWVYDVVADTWTKANDAPIARSHMASASIGDIIYMAGGQRNKDGLTNDEAYKGVVSGDQIQWVKIADLPTPVIGASGGILDGKFYVAGGLTSGGMTDYVYIYNDDDDTWTAGPSLPMKSFNAGNMVSDGRRMFYMGGAGHASLFVLRGAAATVSPRTNDVTSAFDNVYVQPNPAMNMARIGYAISTRSAVSIRIASLLGEQVVDVVSAFKDPGDHEIDVDVSMLSTGMYVVVLNAGGTCRTLTMSVLH